MPQGKVKEACEDKSVVYRCKTSSQASTCYH